MTERVGKAFVLPPGEGRAIDLGGFSVSVKAGADDTDGAFSLLEAMSRLALAHHFTFTTTRRRRSTCWQASTSFIWRNTK